ncbi:MAG: phosphotransferase [Marmoricola sp.]
MLDPQIVLTSIEELLDGAEGFEPLDSVGKSGASLERVRIDGASYVVKYLDQATDWTIRVADVPGTAPVELWRRGVLHALPAVIDQPIVAVAQTPTRSALLMRDMGSVLVPSEDALISETHNHAFLDAMAAMHVRFWETDENVDVVQASRRYLELSPAMAEAEALIGSDHLVPKLVARGWPMLAEVAPAASAVVTPLVHDPSPLVTALAATPQTFVHGNWKLDNLGIHDDGRTVLFDWEMPGGGAPLSDVAWYLAINCRRLPGTKESSITYYRGALERLGIDTEPWWQTQLALCLTGALVQFGWEKALGGYDDELAWWEERAVAAAPLLG